MALGEQPLRSSGGDGFSPPTRTASTPGAVTRLTGVSKVSVGSFHACAIVNLVAVRCWGANGEGELGDETRTNSITPVPVSGFPSVP